MTAIPVCAACLHAIASPQAPLWAGGRCFHALHLPADEPLGVEAPAA